MPTENERTTIETIIARICAKTELLDGAGNPFVELDGLALVAAMQPDGSWADVTYLDDNLLSWAAARHMTRLHTLARGWYQAQSPWYQHNEVFCAILRGLDYWYDRKLQNPNWWWNEIGLPTSLGETLLCLKGCCDHSICCLTSSNTSGIRLICCSEKIARCIRTKLSNTRRVILKGLGCGV